LCTESNNRLIRTCGVLPIVSRIDFAFIVCRSSWLCVGAYRRTRRQANPGAPLPRAASVARHNVAMQTYMPQCHHGIRCHRPAARRKWSPPWQR
jgi:hypothetical protein